MDIEDIQKHLDQIMYEKNNQKIQEFEGYSPTEMHNILYFPFGADSPIILQKLTEADYIKCPMFNLVKYLLDLIKDKGEIKLTAKGFLPTKIVQDIYNQGFIEEYQFSSGICKLYKEFDSITVNLTRILAGLAGLTKKRNGKISLTKNGEKIASDDAQLFESIFKTMTQKFNWGYYDNYDNNQIGQFGFGFSLILLSKYGDKKRSNHFYAQKYFKAFPDLMHSIIPRYGTIEEYANICYSIRTFKRFLDFFGLVEIDKRGKTYNDNNYINKTELFDKLIKIRPHKQAHEL